MKRTSGWTLAVLGILLLTAGCRRQVEVTTVVHRDGTLDRQVVVRSDDEQERIPAYPLVGGQGWQRETEQVEEEEKTRWVTTYRRSFADLEGLREAMRPDPSTPFPLRPEVALDRRFRWFTTRYTWRERVPAVTPYDAIPLPESFSPAEIDSLLRGEADEVLGERLERWQVSNLIEDLAARLRRHVSEQPIAGWESAALDSRQQALLDSLLAKRETLDLEDLTPGVLAIVEHVYERDASALEPAVRGWEDDFMAYLEHTGELGRESYTFQVEMPGRLVETNARNTQDNRASWDFDPEVLRYTAFEMRAVSRVTNGWSLWVTGALLLLLAAAVAFYSSRRPRLRIQDAIH